MTIEKPESAEKLQTRYLRIGLMGALGSGKTTLAKILKQDCRFYVPKEEYMTNPYLAGFYKEPKKYSFLSQFYFLQAKIDQLAKIKDKTVRVIDPDLEMDKIFAKTQYQMGWMTGAEFDLYNQTCNALVTHNNISRPDIYFVLMAPVEVVKERIIERGRKFQKWLFEDSDRMRYVDLLCGNVREWFNLKVRESNFPPVEQINSASYYFAKGPEERYSLAKDVHDAIHYHFINSGENAGASEASMVVPRIKVAGGREWFSRETVIKNDGAR